MRRPFFIAPSVLFVISTLLTCAMCTPQDDGNPSTDSSTPGLQVANGRFVKNGKPYRGMGINYFSLFIDHLDGSRPTLDGLTALAREKVPFVRFPAGPYWPKGWSDTYFKDKEAYFAKLDEVVACAEKSGIGLIPSLFWHPPTFPDLVGEHMEAFGDSRSKTSEFIRQYTRELVERYKDSPAIWGWEFGNEFDLFVDIPHEALPPNPVGMGCPARRDPVRDRMVSSQMINAFKEFGAAARRCDPHKRALFSGNSEPRASAWHNAQNPPQSWVNDNYEQYREIIGRFECDPINTVTARGYCREGTPPLGLFAPSDYMAAMMKISAELHKPLFIGEFGVSDLERNPAMSEAEQARDMKNKFMSRLNAIVDNGVPLSAVWVFDLPQQAGECSITFSNPRSYMIDEVIKANRRLARAAAR